MAHRHMEMGLPAGAYVAGADLQAPPAELKQPQHTLAGVKAQIQPLLQWLQQHAKRLQEAGRWPLQQEDIPEHLLIQWQLYQQHKASLQSSKSTTAASVQTRGAVPLASAATSQQVVKAVSAAVVAPEQAHPDRISVGGNAPLLLPSAVISPACTPGKKSGQHLCLPATPLAATPVTSARKAGGMEPREVADTPTAARGLLHRDLDCIPATDEPAEPSPQTLAQHAARHQGVPRRALFAAGAFSPVQQRQRPESLMSPPRPVLSRKARPVPPPAFTAANSSAQQAPLGPHKGSSGMAPPVTHMESAPGLDFQPQSLQIGTVPSLQVSHAGLAHAPSIMLLPCASPVKAHDVCAGTETGSSLQGGPSNQIPAPGAASSAGLTSPLQDRAGGASHVSAVPLFSPPVRRKALFRQVQSPNLRGAAAERQRCLALTSPQHPVAGFRNHGGPAPSPTAHYINPCGAGGAPAAPLLQSGPHPSPSPYKHRHGSTLMGPPMSPAMLRVPRYDISDVLLGSPSPWKAKSATALSPVCRQAADNLQQQQDNAAAAVPDGSGDASMHSLHLQRQQPGQPQQLDHSVDAEQAAAAKVQEQPQAEDSIAPVSRRGGAAAHKFDEGALPTSLPAAITAPQGPTGRQAKQPQRSTQHTSRAAAVGTQASGKAASEAKGVAVRRRNAAGGRQNPAPKRTAAPPAGEPAVGHADTQPVKPQRKRRKPEYQPMAWVLGNSPSPVKPTACVAAAEDAQPNAASGSNRARQQQQQLHTASANLQLQLQEQQQQQQAQPAQPCPTGPAPVTGRSLRSASLNSRKRITFTEEHHSGGNSELSDSGDDVWSPSAAGGKRGRKGGRHEDNESEHQSEDEQDGQSDESEECVGKKSAKRARQKLPAASKSAARGAKGRGATKQPSKQTQSEHMQTEEGEGDDLVMQSNGSRRRAVTAAVDMAAGPSTKRVKSSNVLNDTVTTAATGLQGDDSAIGSAAASAGAGRAAAGRSKAAGQATGRTRKPAERKNFVKMNACANRGKFSFNFQSKSAAGGRLKASRTRLRRINGKIVRMQFKAPAIAGRGGDVLEGFQASTRCFLCGKTGHWAAQCPSHTGMAPEQAQMAEAEAADAAAAAGLQGIAARLLSPRKGSNPTRPLATAGVVSEPGKSLAGAASQPAAGAPSRRVGVPILRPGQSLAPSRGMGMALPSQEPFQLHKLLPQQLATELAPILGWTFDIPAQQAEHTATEERCAAKPATGCCTEPPGGNAMQASLETGAGNSAGGAAAAVPGHQVAPTSTVAASTTPAMSEADLLEAVGHKVTDAQLQGILQAVWGHAAFRGNQLCLIRAALQGRHVSGMLPTGAGKSLCYQLPALLLPGVTLVVSPLLALMRDQLLRLPKGVPGAMLWGGQTREEAEAVLKAASKGALKLLYIAPEKLHNPIILDALKRLPQRLPLVCVDEAHCVSEWGHSFRPAYYRLGAVLRHVLRPRSLMALTATATHATAQDITTVLGLGETEDQALHVRELPLRDNLRLHVVHLNGGTASGRSCSWLMAQLKEGGQMADTRRLIVYVAFQFDAGQHLHVNTLQAQADEVAQRLTRSGVRAVAYHAGKDMNERTRVQEAFSAGGARVVVATVAFGMGVDQAEVGAVVHLQMPRSLEDYVQQVGRAGRDGSEAHCYLLLDSADFLRLRSLIHSTACEQASVTALLRHIFAPLQESQAALRPAPATGAARSCVCGVLGVKDACLELELDQEAMETCLSYLQGPDGRGLIATLPPSCTALDVRFHHMAPAQLAERAPVVAALLATKPKVIKGIYKVSMAKLVAAAQLSTSAVLAQLSELARKQEIQYELGSVRALAWRVVTQSMPDIQALATQLHTRLIQQEQLNVRRLDSLYALMAGAAQQGLQGSQEAAVRAYVAEYFNSADTMPAMPHAPDLTTTQSNTEQHHQQPQDGVPEPGAAKAAGQDSAAAITEAAVTAALEASGMWSGQGVTDLEAGGGPIEPGQLPVVMQPGRLAIQVAAFLHSQQQQIMSQGRQLHGTAVARIFHGLACPAWPADQWRKCGFWARFTSWDFRAIVDAANKQLPRFYAHQQQQQSRAY